MGVLPPAAQPEVSRQLNAGAGATDDIPDAEEIHDENAPA
jgi:hypothetical protein